MKFFAPFFILGVFASLLVFNLRLETPLFNWSLFAPRIEVAQNTLPSHVSDEHFTDQNAPAPGTPSRSGSAGTLAAAAAREPHGNSSSARASSATSTSLAPQQKIVYASSTEVVSVPSPQQVSPPTPPLPPVLLHTDLTPSAVIEQSTSIELEVHALVNAARAAEQLNPVDWDPQLGKIARAHSLDMLAHNYFAHENPQGCSSACRVSNAGYLWRAVGENIYMMSGYDLTVKQTAEKIVAGWMQSPGHRANILTPLYTHQGIGVAVEGQTIYATEILATPR